MKTILTKQALELLGNIDVLYTDEKEVRIFLTEEGFVEAKWFDVDAPLVEEKLGGLSYQMFHIDHVVVTAGHIIQVCSDPIILEVFDGYRQALTDRASGGQYAYYAVIAGFQVLYDFVDGRLSASGTWLDDTIEALANGTNMRMRPLYDGVLCVGWKPAEAVFAAYKNERVVMPIKDGATDEDLRRILGKCLIDLGLYDEVAAA